MTMDIITLVSGLYLALVAVAAVSDDKGAVILIRCPLGLIGTVMVARAATALGLF